MRDKIAEIIDEFEYSIYHGFQTSKFVADKILALLKQEGWTSPINEDNFEEVSNSCSDIRYEKVLRIKGWLHKDDPVEGLEVTKEQEYNGLFCTLEDKRPLTIAEAISRIVPLKEELEMVMKEIALLKRQLTIC
jgi:carbohydrate-binding DOMON domain-containing protein